MGDGNMLSMVSQFLGGASNREAHGKSQNPEEYALEQLQSVLARKPYANNKEVQEVYRLFGETLRRPSPVGPFINQHLEGTTRLKGDALTVFGNALYLAVMPATKRISILAAHLYQNGFKEEGDLIARNLYDEAGKSPRESHLNLLYTSMMLLHISLMDEGKDRPFISPRSAITAHDLLNLRRSSRIETFDDYLEAQKQRAEKRGRRHSEESVIRKLDEPYFNTVLDIVKLLPDGILDYPQAIENSSHSNQREQLVSIVSGTLQHLVQEVDAARLSSHIHAWHRLVESYRSEIYDGAIAKSIWDGSNNRWYKLGDVFSWSTTHIGEKNGFVELRHVQEALRVSARIIYETKPEIVAEGLNNAAKILQLRNHHWELAVDTMEQLCAGLHPTQIPMYEA